MENKLSDINGIFKTAGILLVVGFIAIFFILTWLFAVGFVIGCLIGMFDLYLIIKTVFMLKMSEEGGSIVKFVLLFMAKTVIILVLLAGIIGLLTFLKLQPMLWGFIGGLLIIPVSILFVTIYNAFAKKGVS